MSRNESFGTGAGEQSGIRYAYEGTLDTGGKTKQHLVTARTPDGVLAGSMVWHAREVHNITVHADHRRKGIATGLWNHAQSIANGRTIPAPKHSSQRTTQGDAWARSVGGRLPRLDRR